MTMTSHDSAISAAAKPLQQAYAQRDEGTPLEAARLAWSPTSRLTLEELAEKIRLGRKARGVPEDGYPKQVAS